MSTGSATVESSVKVPQNTEEKKPNYSVLLHPAEPIVENMYFVVTQIFMCKISC